MRGHQQLKSLLQRGLETLDERSSTFKIFDNERGMGALAERSATVKIFDNERGVKTLVERSLVLKNFDKQTRHGSSCRGRRCLNS